MLWLVIMIFLMRLPLCVGMKEFKRRRKIYLSVLFVRFDVMLCLMFSGFLRLRDGVTFAD